MFFEYVLNNDVLKIKTRLLPLERECVNINVRQCFKKSVTHYLYHQRNHLI